MAKQRMAGGRRAHASTMSLQQSRSEHLLHPFHACACRRKAPPEMLLSSTTAANRRKSVRSKCTAQVLNELPFCLWCRQRQGYENPSLRLFEPIDNFVCMSNP